MRFLLLASFCPLFVVRVWGNQNYFINPPAEGQTVDYSYVNNPIWLWGTNQTVKWSTKYPLFTLYLWQQPVLNGKDYFYPLVANLSNTSSLSWTVGTDLDLNLTNVFCMTIGNGSSTTEYIQSHFFNISWPSSNRSTSSPSPTRVTPYTTLTITATPLPTSQSSLQEISNRMPTQLHKTKLGLAIGIPLALVLGFGIGIGIGRSLLKKKKKKKKGKEEGLGFKDQMSETTTSEIADREPRHELPNLCRQELGGRSLHEVSCSSSGC